MAVFAFLSSSLLGVNLKHSVLLKQFVLHVKMDGRVVLFDKLERNFVLFLETSEKNSLFFCITMRHDEDVFNHLKE